MTRAEAAARRDLNGEFADTADRLYAYDFDFRMHGYMLRAFEPDLPAGRALELGCYRGAFTRRLAEAYDDLTVVEGASELIAVARAATPPAVRFVLSRFEAFAPDERFDAVFLIHALEHLDDPVGLLRRIGDWLSPGGRLFVAVPNAHAASRRIAVEMGLVAHPTAVTPGEHAHGHRRTYDQASLRADIEAAGLRVAREDGVFFKPFANFQFDRLISSGAVDEAYLEGCFKLGAHYPDLCASIFAVCERGST